MNSSTQNPNANIETVLQLVLDGICPDHVVASKKCNMLVCNSFHQLGGRSKCKKLVGPFKRGEKYSQAGNDKE